MVELLAETGLLGGFSLGETNKGKKMSKEKSQMENKKLTKIWMHI